MKSIIKVASLVGGLLYLPSALSNVTNGDFEQWSGNNPTGWTTIDSGISLSPSTQFVRQGSRSAAVNVTTGSQGSTDLRQSVDVVSGQTYNFSVWVYHTEGNMSARLYVNGYQGYSNESQTGQWQQLTHSFTATSNASIEVGLRFYDRSGFDGQELVYVDDFLPRSGSSGGSNGCSGTEGTLRLITDNYGSETSWRITQNGTTVESGSGYSSNTTNDIDMCLSDGDYTYTIDDSYGDGICCSFGSGSYSLTFAGNQVASGGQFGRTESTNFTLGNNGGGTGGQLGEYYSSAQGLTGYALKTELASIISGHTTRTYGDLWTFYSQNERDTYYENDGSILDIYSENPAGNDSYNFTAVTDQCGTYRAEGGCYNREHSLPRSWFGGDVDPMNTDVHHVFATDGFVNARRSSFPYGEVGSATFTSNNGSKLGSAASGLGYSGTVFEPIDEFKGDIARAYFYMATRYQNQIAGWENNSTYGNAVLNGTANQAFEPWVVTLLLRWHQQDPVSQKERDRNEAAQTYQGNRNPFVDHPEFATAIWGN